jgi:hypothetical protein
VSRATEPFGRLPNRLADALALGELTLWGFTILAWLELRTNYRLTLPCWIGTVREMHQAMDWPHSEQHLAKELRRLRADGWVSYEVAPGSRRAFEVFLERAAVYEADQGASWYEKAPRRTSSASTGTSSQRAAKAGQQRPEDTARASSVPAPQTQTQTQTQDAEVESSESGATNDERLRRTSSVEGSFFETFARFGDGGPRSE